jgi:hypothetical protein
MNVPSFRSDSFQRGLARTGTAVWLLAGIALLVATVRAQWLAPGANDSPAPAQAALVPPARADAARAVYRPSAVLESGEEIVLVFIGASFCNALNTPGFPGTVESAKLRVQAHANAAEMRFRAVGVALDWRPADGIAFLARFGEFDEVAAGGNWISDGATKYIWRDIPGDADVPQVLVLRRSIRADRALQVGEDRVLKRLLEWVAAGAKI